MKNLVFVLTLCLAGMSSTAQVADSSKRYVRLDGTVNFRDIGGYVTKDGRHVQWGKIYRSDALGKLSDQDLKKLEKLDVSVVADFRGPYEVKAAPDRLPLGAIRISLPAGSEHIGDSAGDKSLFSQMADSSLIGFYRNTAPFRERYKPVFDALLALNKDSALLFHCTAGKDRTGIAAALILYALGVDEATIMSDYLATNEYRREENVKRIPAIAKVYGISEKVATNMMAAKDEYLRATFIALAQQYGSIDGFLEKEAGLDKTKLEKLKTLYLAE